MKRMLGSMVLGLAVMGCLASAVRADGVSVGQAAPDFTLPNATGNGPAKLALHDYKGKIVVLVWDSTRCPVANAYVDRLNAIDKKYTAGADAKVVLVAINSNKSESIEEIKGHASDVAAVHPIVKDAGNVVADVYGARVTPHVYVVDGTGVVQYTGAVDDSQNEGRVKKTYLADALDALVAGKAVPVAETTAFGCSIKRAN